MAFHDAFSWFCRTAKKNKFGFGGRTVIANWKRYQKWLRNVPKFALVDTIEHIL